MTEPLASHIRPQSLSDVIGQEHLVSPWKPIFEAIEKWHLFSFILWWPPWVGKTTIARIYAESFDAEFFELSAVSAGKADIRKILESKSKKPKILFLDEIHRFNKAQQDFLLPYVENGEITLIGATTENPSFEVISALLSRSQVFNLKELTADNLESIIKRTNISLDTDARDWLVAMANGDARQMLSLLESTSALYENITVETMKQALQNQYLRYDKQWEEHYNTISAFIKSMRASDPDAAMYYLTRMIESGEDPKFIARRMVIFASEDIGMALPTALVVANEVFRAVETIGYPECSINLAHGVTYLATAPKSRASYDALRKAQKDTKKYGNLPIPLHLRNAVTKLMKDQDYGKGYEEYPDTTKNLLPDTLKGRRYFEE